MMTTNFWSRAALCGLILSSITIAYTAISTISGLPGIIGTILWLAKTAGSIYLLVRMMKRFSRECEGSVFGFGLLTSALSALIIAAFMMAGYLWLFPSLSQAMNEAFELSMSQLPALDSAQTDALNNMRDNFGQILAIVYFIKDSLFGLIAAAIISGSINKTTDIFADDKDEELA